MTQLGRVRPSEALALHRGALRQLLNRYGFRQPRVFGSVLTRTDTEESDLDMLVEPVRGTTWPPAMASIASQTLLKTWGLSSAASIDRWSSALRGYRMSRGLTCIRCC